MQRCTRTWHTSLTSVSDDYVVKTSPPSQDERLLGQVTRCNLIGGNLGLSYVMGGQVLAVFSGIFASLASIFSKLALSSSVHALDRHVLSTFCTTEDIEECFPVRTQDITRTIVHACTCCMRPWLKVRSVPPVPCAHYAHVCRCFSCSEGQCCVLCSAVME